MQTGLCGHKYKHVYILVYARFFFPDVFWLLFGVMAVQVYLLPLQIKDYHPQGVRACIFLVQCVRKVAVHLGCGT
jgi:hypothetical protein